MNNSLISLWRRIPAVVRQRCPRCLQGPLFAKLLDMNLHCPVCGLEFEREAGYFLGAMYFSYGLAILTGAPTFITLLYLGVANQWILLVVGLQLALTSPWLWRYSRTMWLHLDQIVDPR